jgi:hypothetical protein
MNVLKGLASSLSMCILHVSLITRLLRDTLHNLQKECSDRSMYKESEKMPFNEKTGSPECCFL